LNTTAKPPQIFDRQALIRHRERAALEPNIPDFLLHYVADDLEERLGVIQRTFPTVLCLSAATGVLADMIRRRAGTERVISSELSPTLMRRLASPALVLDEEALFFTSDMFLAPEWGLRPEGREKPQESLKPGGLDLVLSALTLQFVNDLPGALTQIRQALKPDGLFLGAMAGGATLTELRQAALEAETEIYGGASPRVAPFADVRDLGGLLQRAGFALPVVDSETVTVTYASPLYLMRELKAMGAVNVLTERRRLPMTRGFLMRIAEIYAARFPDRDGDGKGKGDGGGRIRATFELLTMTGWAPHESQQQPLKPGSAKARLAEALGVPETSAGEKPGSD